MSLAPRQCGAAPLKMKKNSPHIANVHLIRTQIFFKNLNGSALALFATGILLALGLYETDTLSALPAAGWLLFLGINCGCAFAFERHVKKTNLTEKNAARFFYIRTALGALSYATIGFSTFFLLILPSPSATAYTLVFIALSSVLTVAYMAYGTMFSYCLLANALTMLPFSVFCIARYLETKNLFLLILGITTIFWQLVVGAKALKISRSVIHEIIASEKLHQEIHEHRLTEAALKASQENSHKLATMMRMMCDNVPDFLWAEDTEGRFLFANQALCEKMLNTRDTSLPIGQTLESFILRERAAHPEDPDWYSFWPSDRKTRLLRADALHFSEASGTALGRFLVLDIHDALLIDATGKTIGVAGCARDITEQKSSANKMQHIAHHDPLTDLANRILLMDRLQQALELARRNHEKLAILFIDLDRFKPVNDTLGHGIGDLLLKAVAKRLLDIAARRSDTVARIGGDEFVVLLQRLPTEQEALLMSESIQRALNQVFVIEGHEIYISSCVGIAIFPQHGTAPNELIRNADAAMYAAKRSGRNAYRLFET